MPHPKAAAPPIDDRAEPRLAPGRSMHRTLLTWLNDHVGYVRVRTKLTIAFTLLSGVPLVVGGTVGTLVASAALEDQALRRLEAEADTMRAGFDSTLANIASDLDLLSAAPELALLVSDRAAQAATTAGQRFRRYLGAKSQCVQIRVLDVAGEEIMSVQTSGRSLAGPTGAAQPHYADLVLEGAPGAVAVSAAELSMATPLAPLPVISLARGVYADDELLAVLVLDVFAAELFPQRTISGTQAGTVIVVDDQRRYLYDSRYEDDWNRFLKERSEVDVADLYLDVSDQILSGRAGALPQANGHIVVFRPLLLRQGHYLVLIHSVPRAAALEAVARIQWIFLILFGVSVALATLASRFGASQFTAPIQRLAEGARRLEGRDYSHRLPMRGYDELDDLAATFNSMADAIEQRDGRILAYTQDLESEVRQRTEELLHAERLAAVGEMVAGIAHEIGTPLNVISGYAEDLLLQLDDNEASEDLRLIVSETARIADLVRGLQDFARARPTARDWLDIGGTADEVTRLLRGAARAHGVDIEIDTIGEPTLCYVDPQSIKQALLNLVINAIHASESGDCVRIQVREGDNRTLVTVTDEGTGMDPDVRNRIFEPFFSTKPPGQGTGLGLAIVKRIVQAHGGSITVESETGVGSRFAIALPNKEHDVDASR